MEVLGSLLNSEASSLHESWIIFDSSTTQWQCIQTMCAVVVVLFLDCSTTVQFEPTLTTLKEKRNAPLIFLKFLPEFCEIKCMCLNPTYVLDILAQ